MRSPTFNIQDLAFVRELLRRNTNPNQDDLCPSQEIQETISALTLTADAAQFDTDKARLAHDVSRYAAFLQAGKDHDKKQHLLKVLHLKSMNAAGAAIISSWMRRRSYHVCGDPEKSDRTLDQAAF